VPHEPTVSVIIPAYTLDRWSLICEAIDSLQSQTRLPDEIILCIDRNEELYERALLQWGDANASPVPIRVLRHDENHDDDALGFHVRAHGSRRRFGAGAARNLAASVASGDLLLFQDDDALADPRWVEKVIEAFEDRDVVAVGGAPLPRYETERPRWMPREFDWVFGCAYDGLPTRRAPARHLIGANLSVRRAAFEHVGGFHSIDFDDLDLCHRLAARFSPASIVYDPDAVVHHFVSADRVSWRYFWRRPFYVNRAKVIAFAEMGDAANLRAEVYFVLRSLTLGSLRSLKEFVRGDLYALARVGALVLGITLAGLGHVIGQVEHRVKRDAR
jgi:GT2 family glycosyltransferase